MRVRFLPPLPEMYAKSAFIGRTFTLCDMILSRAVEQIVYDRADGQVEQNDRGNDHRAENEINVVHACTECEEAYQNAYHGQLDEQHSSVEHRQLKVEIRPCSPRGIDKVHGGGDKTEHDACDGYGQEVHIGYARCKRQPQNCDLSKEEGEHDEESIAVDAV